MGKPHDYFRPCRRENPSEAPPQGSAPQPSTYTAMTWVTTMLMSCSKDYNRNQHGEYGGKYEQESGGAKYQVGPISRRSVITVSPDSGQLIVKPATSACA